MATVSGNRDKVFREPSENSSTVRYKAQGVRGYPNAECRTRLPAPSTVGTGAGRQGIRDLKYSERSIFLFEIRIKRETDQWLFNLVKLPAPAYHRQGRGVQPRSD